MRAEPLLQVSAGAERPASLRRRQPVAVLRDAAAVAPVARRAQPVASDARPRPELAAAAGWPAAAVPADGAEASRIAPAGRMAADGSQCLEAVPADALLPAADRLPADGRHEQAADCLAAAQPKSEQQRPAQAGAADWPYRAADPADAMLPADGPAADCLTTAQPESEQQRPVQPAVSGWRCREADRRLADGRLGLAAD